MPVQAIALATILMSASLPSIGGLAIERVAAPCHLAIDGECKVERKADVAAAGNGGQGGNGTVNYNIYFNANPAGGDGGAGGGVKTPSAIPGKSPPASAAPPADARQGAAPTAAGLEDAVSYFTWTYDFEPEPGVRVWSRKGSRWSERYPSGKVAKVYNSVLPGTVQGCPGQLVSHTADPSFEVYIPNKGCKRMVALFRRDMGAWSALGPMRDVR